MYVFFWGLFLLVLKVDSKNLCVVYIGLVLRWDLSRAYKCELSRIVSKSGTTLELTGNQEKGGKQSGEAELYIRQKHKPGRNH